MEPIKIDARLENADWPKRRPDVFFNPDGSVKEKPESKKEEPKK